MKRKLQDNHRVPDVRRHIPLQGRSGYKIKKQ